MISNNKISHLISSQVPFFVRNDHEKFMAFLEAYYAFVEQETGVVNRIKEIRKYQDIDRTIDEFTDHLYDTFTKLIPENILADRALILKHVKDFYRAKGSEKSVKFLLRIMFGEEIDMYYPKKDVIRASDGKWFVQRSLRVSNTAVNYTSDDSLTTFEKYVGTQIRGNTSNSSAIVERVDRFFDHGTRIDELMLSNINGEFENGEYITAVFDDTESTKTLSSDIFGGIINTISITDTGSGYQVGDPVVVISSSGAGACVTVSSVSTGNQQTVTVVSGGAGYANDNYMVIAGGGGTGANGKVSSVADDGFVHPNTYNIVASTISLEANTLIGNAVYSNLNSTNANSTIASGMSYWQYSNTGPARTILMINGGQNYSSNPTLSIAANSKILTLGILGRMEIIDGGSGYQVGDEIHFTNVTGGYGAGALANVTNVGAANTITEVKFKQMDGHIIGGSGYDYLYLPTASVISANGTNANIAVTAILGTGAQFVTANSTIGAVQRVIINNRGSGYADIPLLDLSGSGDGLANATASIITGVYDYPGRYLNDDGHLSSYNFIQDRDYYQEFSYVVKIKQSIDSYRRALKELIHPAGTKMFGEYVSVDEQEEQNNYSSYANTVATSIVKLRTYTKTSNTINVAYGSHGLSVNSEVGLEFTSGGSANVVNGIYSVTQSSADSFLVSRYVSGSANTSGNVEVSIVQL